MCSDDENFACFGGNSRWSRAQEQLGSDLAFQPLNLLTRADWVRSSVRAAKVKLPDLLSATRAFS